MDSLYFEMESECYIVSRISRFLNFFPHNINNGGIFLSQKRRKSELSMLSMETADDTLGDTIGSLDNIDRYRR